MLLCASTYARTHEGLGLGLFEPPGESHRNDSEGQADSEHVSAEGREQTEPKRVGRRKQKAGTPRPTP